MGDGTIFLLADKNAVGDLAQVQTADDFHTYRIEVTSNDVDVYYDGNPTLEDDLFLWAGESQKINFGDGSGVASGEADWLFVRHNAIILEPATLSLPALGGLVALRRRR